MRPKIPKELVKAGLVWGFSTGIFWTYAETRKHLKGVPDEIEGVRVKKIVVGKIRPA